ncbi:MAG: GNAT family N-acetyltransferase [Kangiellaceae bacterium]|nr:GNAT family N-acetyltransferase [Kangiellaceae bacterium]
MKIRQCDIKDLDIITEFTARLQKYENDGQLIYHPNFELNLKRWIEAEILSSNSLLLIAEVKGNPVGFIASSSSINDNGFLSDPIKGIVQLLWVEPHYRQQKFAKHLLENVETCFKELGINYVECSFTEKNKEVGSFWQANGYFSVAHTARKILTPPQ